MGTQRGEGREVDRARSLSSMTKNWRMVEEGVVVRGEVRGRVSSFVRQILFALGFSFVGLFGHFRFFGILSFGSAFIIAKLSFSFSLSHDL